MFKSKAKQRAYEEFHARRKLAGMTTKHERKTDYMRRHISSKPENVNAEGTKITHCDPYMPNGKRVGRKHIKNKWIDVYIPHSLLNTKKAKSVASPLQSWIAHY